ncbi:hypothetical protein GIB67_018019 [Kingdonia uniflora]|uniref:Carbonic anhydrase n=1 Tax=Kingdonia uniflora TaxID=39325 RepID=A0A7J7NWA9_9MAGN|nr:hypothetical protein GIB67_018019 [Kingdonia uniflora]
MLVLAFLLLIPISQSTTVMSYEISQSTTAMSHEVENQTEFDYMVWSGKGPDRWGDIHPEWSACKQGGLQSPIDLLNKRVALIPALGLLKRTYKPTNATLKNRGHDIMLKWEHGAGTIQINGIKYELSQVHWHSPSEHTIDGKRFDVEVHMVHLSLDPNAANKIAVLGILYHIGRPDPFLNGLRDHLLYIADSHKEVNIGVIDPRHIQMRGVNYYRYIGSLTVPPCTEGVIWTMNRDVGTISKEQIDLLRASVHDHSAQNARPLQLLHDRDIHLYD